jgi:hypothetical protein
MAAQVDGCIEETLDEAAFKRFAPLLAASQRYASLSGCRFQNTSFRGVPRCPESTPEPAEMSHDSGPRFAAKIKAAPLVDEFAARLRAGEPGLVEEMERAHRIVMAESVRNAMIGMFQALEMFPPAPPPDGIEDDDCAFEDVSAPLPAIAQRLYNDQARRVSDTTGGPGRLERRAMTAAFIVDFTDEAGVELPPMPETQASMLKEFVERTNEFAEQKPGSDKRRHHAREAFLGALELGGGSVGRRLKQEANQWWAENWQGVAWTVAGAIAVGAAAVATAALSGRANERRSRR